ncbi:DNA polymerase thumb domain-containing protein [Bacillus atrophaeus]|uniref:Y-family DNA polymerase n=1 Tax=Bacillus atrophaeus TaxID=1452 RepID=UPI000B455E58|nr:UV damage repair protein UvrX [Bacillus atrophaeus]ARW07041.1 Putative UV-damage repair protein UvrX [Bacillus atrophaeus]
MIGYSQFPRKNILCIDMKSFYASVSAVTMGLNPMTCYLAVVGNTDRQGSVVLAASPTLKKDFGIKTGSRLFEIPDDPRIHVVNPQMKLFIRVSSEITKLFYRFVPEKCVHTYSIDESFLDAGKENPEEMAKAIQSSMWREFGLMCTVGIGDNILLSKLALDLGSKKTKSGIARWRYEDVPNKLWKVHPLSKMWGIGGRMERNLNRMGISTVGQLAKFPLELLEKKFGIMGNQLFYHAHGIDLSEIGAPLMQGQISYGKSQILLLDYTKKEDIKAVLLEICEEVARRARTHNKVGRTISLGIGYSKDEFGGGFHRTKTIDLLINITMDIYRYCLMLLDKFYTGKTVRSISVTLSNIEEDVNQQLSLFEKDSEKRRKLGFVMDGIRSKYGSKAILRAVSYTPAGTALYRAGLTGGHKS